MSNYSCEWECGYDYCKKEFEAKVKKVFNSEMRLLKQQGESGKINLLRMVESELINSPQTTQTIKQERVDVLPKVNNACAVGKLKTEDTNSCMEEE